MRVVAKIQGIAPPDWLNSRSRVAAQAISIGIDAAGKGAQQDIRAMIRAAGTRAAQRDHILGQVERWCAVVVEILPNRIRKGRRIDALDVEQEIVRTDGVQAVGFQPVLREVGEIEGDDTARLAHNRRRENVPIVWIGQIHGRDERLVPRDQRIEHGRVHRAPRSGQVVCLQVRPVLEQVSDPLLVDGVTPPRPEQLRLREVESEAAEARAIEDVRVKERREGRDHASVEPQPLGLRSHVGQRLATLFSGGLLEGQKIGETHPAVATNHAVRDLAAVDEPDQKRP